MKFSINNTSTSPVSRGFNMVILSVLAIIVSLYGTITDAAGYRKISDKNVEFGVWYPTNAAGELQRLGPFETVMAKDAPVRAGRHPIILFSHGNSGRFRNHYLTAQALADAGYIVIAPQHQADHLVGSRKTAEALDHRYLELELSLHAVRNSPDFNPYIAPGPINGVGYSLGGFTIMLAAGGSFASETATQHCKEFAREDAAFCESPGFIFRTVQGLRANTNLRATTDPFRHAPIITGKAVVIAPVYQGLTLDDQLALSKLTVIAITGDMIAQPRFHAEPLAKAALAQNSSSQLKTIKGHHYAFIAPFPKWLTDQEDIPVAKDPAGFDRPAFLSMVNGIILEALGNP